MKKCIVFFLLFLISTNHNLFGQENRKEKFSIQLPQEWKRKPKFLLKLVSIINSHIPQLENIRECLNCKAAYYVRFFVSQPTVEYIYYHPTSSYGFTTMFHFYSYMEVSDSTGSTFHRLILNDTSTVHTFPYKLFGKGSTIQPVQYSIAQLKNNALPATVNGQRTLEIDLEDRTENISTLAKQFDSDQFIKMNLSKLTPSESYLWGKVQEIIMAYQMNDIDKAAH